ncbi:ATP-binding protein [Paenibacillus solanacearum]|nr:ATP-binding protein [Paenibacillus solanacearum]
MECILFVGIQASGKSTFYKETFFHTHVRINLDMLRTRHREHLFLMASLEAKQPFVIDNTNPTTEERRPYIELAKRHRFRVTGYFFEPDYEESVIRNDRRTGKSKVPTIGIRSALNKLQPPEWSEGFDALYRVRAAEGQFRVEPMR